MGIISNCKICCENKDSNKRKAHVTLSSSNLITENDNNIKINNQVNIKLKSENQKRDSQKEPKKVKLRAFISTKAMSGMIPNINFKIKNRLSLFNMNNNKILDWENLNDNKYLEKKLRKSYSPSKNRKLKYLFQVDNDDSEIEIENYLKKIKNESPNKNKNDSNNNDITKDSYKKFRKINTSKIKPSQKILNIENNSNYNQEQNDDQIEISNEDVNLIKDNIKNIFPKLNNKEINFFISNFFFQDFLKNTKLNDFQIGNRFYYIIKNGHVGIFYNHKLKKLLSKGDSFGNINIIDEFSPLIIDNNDNGKNMNNPNQFKFICMSDVSLFLISNHQIQELNNRFLEKKHNLIVNSLNEIKLFKMMSHLDKLPLIETSSIIYKHENEIIQEKNSYIDSIYIIISGEVVVKEINKEYIKKSTILSKKKTFLGIKSIKILNEELLYTQSKIKSVYTYKTKTSCQIIKLSIFKMMKVYGSSIFNYLYYKSFLYFIPKCKTLEKIIKEECANENIKEITAKQIFLTDIYNNNDYNEFNYSEDQSICSNMSINSKKLEIYINQKRKAEENIENLNNSQNNNYNNKDIYYKDNDHKKYIYEKFLYRKYNNNELIMSSSDNKLVLILKGEILNLKSKKIHKDYEFLYKELENFDEYISLSKQVYVLEANINILIKRNIYQDEKYSLSLIKSFVSKCDWIENLSNETLLQLGRLVQEEKITDRKMLIKQGENVNGIYLVKSGLVYKESNNTSKASKDYNKLSNNTSFQNNTNTNTNTNSHVQSIKSNIEYVKANEVFGQEELFLNAKSKFTYYTYNIIKTQSNLNDDQGKSHLKSNKIYKNNNILNINNQNQTVILKLSKEAIKSVLSENMIKYIVSLYLSNDYKFEEQDYERKENMSCLFNQLNIKLISYLGNGSFGSVSLVKIKTKFNIDNTTHDKNKNMIFALKAVPKNSLRNKSFQYNYLINEKKCLSICKSPFIMSLNKTFNDNNFCYFLLEYINGINLSKVESSYFNGCTFDCLFYFINLLFILEHLKKRSILHRDIKLSNILIDKNGYLKLIDFGLAKRTNDFTSTSIGTSYYMSPEVIIGNGYTYTCDYWSIGIVLYKIFYGVFPFGNDSYNNMDIYNSILHSSIKFPPISSNIKENTKKRGMLMRNLSNGINDLLSVEDVVTCLKYSLNKNPNERKCSLKIYKTVFKDKINLFNIQDMKQKPPYIPIVNINKEAFYNKNDSELMNNNEKNSNRISICEGVEFQIDRFKKIVYDKMNYKEKSEISSIINKEEDILKKFL